MIIDPAHWDFSDETDPQVLLVGFYPRLEDFFEHDEDQWRSYMLSRSYYRSCAIPWRCSLHLVHEPDQIVYPKGRPIISVEEPGPDTIDLRDFKHPRDAMYIFGNMDYQRPSEFLPKGTPKVTISHPTQVEGYEGVALYGALCAAMICYDRHQKGYG